MTKQGFFLQVLLFLSLGIQNGNNETVCILMIRFSLSHSTKYNSQATKGESV